MSESGHPPETKTTYRSRRAKTIGKWVVGICIGILVGLVLIVSIPGSFDVLWALASGWFTFLQRTLPNITWNGSLVGMGVLCSMIALGLAHGFLRSVIKAGQRWRFRWTVCGLMIVGLVFLVGMSVAGVVHQVGWIVGSDEAMIVSNRQRLGLMGVHRQRVIRRDVEMFVRLESDVEKGVARFEKEFWDLRKGPPFDRPPAETYRAIVLMDEDGNYCGVLTFPRARPSEKRWVGLVHLANADEEAITEEEELGRLLDQFRDRLHPIW